MFAVEVVLNCFHEELKLWLVSFQISIVPTAAHLLLTRKNKEGFAGKNIWRADAAITVILGIASNGVYLDLKEGERTMFAFHGNN